MGSALWRHLAPCFAAGSNDIGLLNVSSNLTQARRAALLLWLPPVIVGWLTTGLRANEPPLKDRTEIARLQIFLDQAHFSPGGIDGQWGTFTQRALSFYAQHAPTQDLSLRATLKLARQKVPVVFKTHRVRASDRHWVGELAGPVDAQARQKRLPYSSLSEFLAERYHTQPIFLKELNPHLDLDAAKTGDLVAVPNIKEIFRIETMQRDARQRKHTSLHGEAYLLVDTKVRMASLYRGTRLLAAFPITHGRPRFVPRGRWKIVNMITLPSFRWDDRMLKEGERSSQSHLLPPGPNNPVGVFWAGLNKPGIGLHGTRSPESIGRSHSAGCIRFTNWDAVRLPLYLKRDSEVWIR